MSSRIEHERSVTTIRAADGESVLHEVRTIFGRKWQPVLVYRLLEDGPTGFSTLKRSVDGISSKMLSESLDALGDAGIVERIPVEDSPGRVKYRLTEQGELLEPIIIEMVRWGVANRDEISSDASDDTRRTEL